MYLGYFDIYLKERGCYISLACLTHTTDKIQQLEEVTSAKQLGNGQIVRNDGHTAINNKCVSQVMTNASLDR